MIKNIVRFKQWAGEKFGQNQSTSTSEEFQILQQDTEKHHQHLEQVYKAAEHVSHCMNKNISKLETGHNRTPFGLFGEILVSHSHNFDCDSAPYVLMNSFGLSECQLSDLEIDLATKMKEDYISFLSEFCHSFKEYQSLSRKLESKRLDYDAKCSQLQRVKKEKPDIEREVRAAKIKYEETKYKVAEQMEYLQESELEHCKKLRILLNDQLSYHKQATKVLESLCNKLDGPLTNDVALVKSQSKLSTQPTNNTATSSIIEENAPPKEKRRAIYEHIQNHADELTFYPGDIITVINRVDEGWWLGKITDSGGNVSRGIFPVNYTKPYHPNDDDDDYRSSLLKSPTTSTFSNSNNHNHSGLNSQSAISISNNDGSNNDSSIQNNNSNNTNENGTSNSKENNKKILPTTTATTNNNNNSNNNDNNNKSGEELSSPEKKSDQSLLSNEKISTTPFAPPSPASSRESCTDYNHPLPKIPSND
ncbi:unnamed protein product [Cunninghamella blakesleeana]